MERVLDVTRLIPLLAACKLEDRDAFEQLVERKSFEAGDEILAEGETDQALWMILEGTCEVMKHGNGHEEQKLAVLEAGSVFGEMSFLKRAPHSATVRALTPVEVARLTPEAFDRLRQNSPAAAFCIVMNLVNLLSDRLRSVDERICEILDGDGADLQRREWHDFRARLFAGDFN
jgi:cAMP-dependent protein kinase regulator